MTRWLVTGASGFIGSHVCAALAREDGVRVRALLRRDAPGPWHERVVGTLPEDVPAHAFDDVDVVVHAAGRAHVFDGDAAAFARVNVDGTARVAEAARRAGVRRFVLVSSVAAVGEGRAGRVPEDAPLMPVDAYGRSRRDAEAAARTVDADAVIVRLPMVYGPGAPGNLRRMIRAVRAGYFPPPPRRCARRSMIHVDDAVGALCLAARAEAARGRTYTATDGVGWTARELWELICRALGRRADRPGLPRAAWVVMAWGGELVGRVLPGRAPLDRRALARLLGPAQFADDAIRRELGWRPRRRLDEAMPAIVEAALR